MRSLALELPKATLAATSASVLATNVAVGAASTPAADLAACSGRGPKPRAAALHGSSCWCRRWVGWDPCETYVGDDWTWVTHMTAAAEVSHACLVMLPGSGREAEWHAVPKLQWQAMHMAADDCDSYATHDRRGRPALHVRCCAAFCYWAADAGAARWQGGSSSNAQYRPTLSGDAPSHFRFWRAPPLPRPVAAMR